MAITNADATPPAPSPVETTQGFEPRRRRRRRRWLIVVAIIGAVLVAFAGVTFGRYAFRERPGPQEIETALQRFRALPPPATPPHERYRFPAAGVYELAGQGSEHISFPPNSQKDGSLMPATVSYRADGCWLWRVDYNVAHWEDFAFCPRNGELVLAGNSNSQTWDFGVAKITNVAQFSCDQPATVLSDQPRTGQKYERACSGTNSAIRGTTTTSTTTTIIGPETVTVGAKAHATIHQRQDSTISGEQSGTETSDWWLAADSGLPLRVERHIKLQSSSPLGGTITYTEDGAWQMRSLQTQT